MVSAAANGPDWLRFHLAFHDKIEWQGIAQKSLSERFQEHLATAQFPTTPDSQTPRGVACHRRGFPINLSNLFLGFRFCLYS